MDEKTRKFLTQVNPPANLMKKLFREERPWQGEREKLEAMSKDKRNLTQQQREKVKRVLEANQKSGVFERKTISVDPEVAKKVEKFHKQRIESGIASGEIERFDPAKDPQARRLFRASRKRKP